MGMKLTENEKQTILDYFDTDLNIEIKRRRYYLVLENDVYYDHKADGNYEKLGSEKRDIEMWHPNQDVFVEVKGFEIEDADEMIALLSNINVKKWEKKLKGRIE